MGAHWRLTRLRSDRSEDKEEPKPIIEPWYGKEVLGFEYEITFIVSEDCEPPVSLTMSLE